MTYGEDVIGKLFQEILHQPAPCGNGVVTIPDGGGSGVQAAGYQQQWLPCLATSGNYQLASNISLSAKPIPGGLIVFMSVPQQVGDGQKDRDCYFSNDNGVSACTYAQITVGSKLYWNGLVSGFNLTTDKRIYIYYPVAG